jgi:hypothetical protein
MSNAHVIDEPVRISPFILRMQEIDHKHRNLESMLEKLTQSSKELLLHMIWASALWRSSRTF